MKMLALNEFNRRIGSSHPNAKLTDEEVDQIHELREEGMSLSALAQRFGVGKAAVWKIVNGHRRCQTPMRWRKAPDAGSPQRRSTDPGMATTAKWRKSPEQKASRELDYALRSWF